MALNTSEIINPRVDAFTNVLGKGLAVLAGGVPLAFLGAEFANHEHFSHNTGLLLTIVPGIAGALVTNYMLPKTRK